MRPVDALLEEYGESHKNAVNKAIHWVCVPVILFSTIGLFWAIPSGFMPELGGPPWLPLNWATVLMAVALVFYLTLRWTIALGMLVVSLASLWGNYQIEVNVEQPLWAVSLGLFFVAWVGCCHIFSLHL